MSYLCFNKECSRYKNTAVSGGNRGVLLIGCACGDDCDGPYSQSHCSECGSLIVKHDNYLSDERTEKQKFDGTDLSGFVAEKYIQQKYE